MNNKSMSLISIYSQTTVQKCEEDLRSGCETSLWCGCHDNIYSYMVSLLQMRFIMVPKRPVSIKTQPFDQYAPSVFR